MSPVILYAEVPSFYAEVERANDPSLAERPVIVGGDPRRRGLVQDATDDARALGVVPGMTMQEALQRCPRARALRTHMPRYREVSRRVRAVLRRRAERLEPEGLAGAYLDATEVQGPPAALAAQLRAAVRAELRLPLRVGVAANKLVARLAAEEAGANGVREVAAGEEAAFLAPLPVSRMPGVGRHTEERLAQLGARLVGDLARVGREALESAFGNRGLELLALARGHADQRVRGERYPGSLSQEATLDGEETDLAVLGAALERLASGLEAALRLQGIAARRIVLKVRYADQETTTRSRTLPHGLAAAADVAAVARELLGRTNAGVRPIRLVGIALGAFARARRDDRQLELFPRPE